MFGSDFGRYEVISPCTHLVPHLVPSNSLILFRWYKVSPIMSINIHIRAHTHACARTRARTRATAGWSKTRVSPRTVVPFDNYQQLKRYKVGYEHGTRWYKVTRHLSHRRLCHQPGARSEA